MIRTSGLTKTFGARVAVDDLTIEVEPGRVTGFLGPNGAGKSTTLRLLLGLDAPTRGTATVNGRPYRELRDPIREVGALLDARAVQGGRTARAHLRALAALGGLPPGRVPEVLERTGLTDAADRRARTFSLGMSQRLGLAAALLGDPRTLVLDEPVNGLDTEGIRWVRGLLRALADEGRTVLLASHIMSEMELTADHLVVIGRGRLLADLPLREFLDRHSRPGARVRTPDPEALSAELARAGAHVTRETPDLLVEGMTADEVGALAAARGIVLHGLAPHRSSLEDIYTELTTEQVEYAGRGAA